MIMIMIISIVVVVTTIIILSTPKLLFFRQSETAAAGSSLSQSIGAKSTSHLTAESVSDPPNVKETQLEHFDVNSKSTVSYEDKLELQILIEPASTTASINVIFIHGLGGKPCGTWTNEQTNFFWPAFLSKEKGLEHLRVMTFGYNAIWQNLWKKWQGQTQLNIADFASQLMNRLRVHYNEYPDVWLLLMKTNPIDSNCVYCTQYGWPCC
jgi:hypothetical protein